jgi:hypothetical protein
MKKQNKYAIEPHGMNETYKVSGNGWLCIKFEAYKWIAVCRLTDDQLKILREKLGIEE